MTTKTTKPRASRAKKATASAAASPKEIIIPGTIEGATIAANRIREAAYAILPKEDNFTVDACNRRLRSAIANQVYFFNTLYKPSVEDLTVALRPLILDFVQSQALGELTDAEAANKLHCILGMADAYGLTLAPTTSLTVTFATLQQRAAQARHAFVEQHQPVTLPSVLAYYRDVFWAHTVVDLIENKQPVTQTIEEYISSAKQIGYALINGLAHADALLDDTELDDTNLDGHYGVMLKNLHTLSFDDYDIPNHFQGVLGYYREGYIDVLTSYLVDLPK